MFSSLLPCFLIFCRGVEHHVFGGFKAFLVYDRRIAAARKLVHVGGRARCTAEHARPLVWQEAEPEEGLHMLAAAGPWPNAGALRAKDGRIVWQWQCSRCGARASDSSRAAALLKKVCKGNHGVTMEEAPHEWADTAAGPTCSRCKLVRGNGRAIETAGKVCPVMTCKKAGHPWPEGEASQSRMPFSRRCGCTWPASWTGGGFA